jgi:peptidoglycan/LPS O-acetylase OafA/YrhL
VNTSINSQFRSDINGLRAWAVMAVVLYHFGMPGAAGGFQGVDVFFVISGFLMTGLVVSGLEKSGLRYSIADFYLARARRIVPALVVVCMSLVLMGWWVLPAPDYRKLADHASLSMLFLSNLKYLHEAGYFDALSHEKWLLHTWSLSVEWQFYLAFPILMKLLWRIKPTVQFLATVCSLLMFCSLGACIWLTTLDASQAFYLFPTRAWEMLSGGLVFFTMKTRLHNSQAPYSAGFGRNLHLIGFMSIIGSMGVFSGNDPWPGWGAILPVAGASLVLLARREDSTFTGHGLFQWLGDRSYSIYLWHWPFVVVLNYMELQASMVWGSIGVLVSLLMGALSYRWVETPSRKQLARMSRNKASWATVLLIVIPLSLTSWILIKKGIPNRVAPASELALKEQKNTNPRDKECHISSGSESPGCVYGGSNVRAIVIGDSHANAIVNAVADARPIAEDGVLEWSYSGCPFLQDAKIVDGKFDATHQCYEFVQHVLKKLDAGYAGIPVVIINRWAQYAIGRNEKITETNVPWVTFGKKYSFASADFLQEYADNMVSTACHLAVGRKVYLMRPVPEMGVDVPSKLARTAIWGGEMDVRVLLQDYMQRQQFIWQAQDRAHRECGVELLNPTSILCTDGYCHGADGGRPLYFDDDHLSEFGNRKLVPMFRRVFLK